MDRLHRCASGLRVALSAALWVALSVAVAACSTLPVVPPDAGATNPDPANVAFQTASGRLLSPAQSRALVDRLGGDQSDSLARHLAVEQSVAGEPLSLGNEATLLEDGPDTYASMLKVIAAARDHINMETYIFDDDEAGNHFADVLMEKSRAGVAVNLIHDSVGTLKTPRAFFDRLRTAGINVVEFNPVNPLRAPPSGWDPNKRDHRKLLVVDGRTAIMGGINISGVYSSSSGGSGGSGGGSRGGAGGSAGFGASRPPTGSPANDLPWRDTDVRLDGPVVASLQKIFFATWESQQGPAVPARDYYPAIGTQGRSVVRAIASDPNEPFSRIYVTLLSAINSADAQVWLTNAYFVPDPQLVTALTSAAQRGVDVRLIVPSATDSSLVFHAGRAHYQKLLDGGVRLFEREGALLHAKTGVIDGVWSTIGSANLDWRSFLHNQELTAVILGDTFGDKMRAAFERDLAGSREITREAWRQRGASTRAKEWFSRLLEYWL